MNYEQYLVPLPNSISYIKLITLVTIFVCYFWTVTQWRCFSSAYIISDLRDLGINITQDFLFPDQLSVA